MEAVRRQLKHELLNIFTILKIIISDSQYDPNSNILSNFIKRGSMLVGHEELILKNNPEVFVQKISVIECLNSVLESNNQLDKDNFIITLEGSDFFISTDRYYLYESFHCLIGKICRFSDVAIVLDDLRQTILFYFCNNKLSDFKKVSFKSVLNRKCLENEDLGLQIALRIFDLINVKVSIESSGGKKLKNKFNSCIKLEF